MKSLQYVSRNDSALVAAVATQYPDLSPYRMQIRVAYCSYARSRCSSLMPIELNDPAIAALKLAYSSEAKSAKLNWIDEVRNGHELNFCPLCGGPGARTIEHHLSKDDYPEFSVFSMNLVPSCGTCNSKRGKANKPGDDWTLHPYFDGELLNKPLVYVVIQPPWMVPAFRLAICDGLTETEEAKVRLHLGKSIDQPLFKSWIAGQWGDLRTIKVPQFGAHANLKLALKNELAGESTRNINSWNAALLRGVLKVDGLCEWLVDNKAAEIVMTDAQMGL